MAAYGIDPLELAGSRPQWLTINLCFLQIDRPFDREKGQKE
jgi:hypothetical protein